MNPTATIFSLSVFSEGFLSHLKWSISNHPFLTTQLAGGQLKRPFAKRAVGIAHTPINVLPWELFPLPAGTELVMQREQSSQSWLHMEHLVTHPARRLSKNLTPSSTAVREVHQASQSNCISWSHTLINLLQKCLIQVAASAADSGHRSALKF